MANSCPICGVEEQGERGEYWGGAMLSVPSVRLDYKGCCSPNCAQAQAMAEAVSKLALAIEKLEPTRFAKASG